MVLTAVHGDIIGHSDVDMIGEVAQYLKQETGFFSNFYYFSLHFFLPTYVDVLH